MNVVAAMPAATGVPAGREVTGPGKVVADRLRGEMPHEDGAGVLDLTGSSQWYL